MSLTDVFAIVRDVTITGLLLAALIGGSRRTWVFGWVHADLLKERDEWKALAQSLQDLLEKAHNERREHFLIAHPDQRVPNQELRGR